MENNFLFFENDAKVLILSPHPDDDVIGMGATIHYISNFLDPQNFHIAYMVSGSNSADHIIRKKEAIDAVKTLCDEMPRMHFLDLTFYTEKRSPSEIDELMMSKFIRGINPTYLFFAGDVDDPNKTHLKCYKLTEKVLKNITDIKVYLYFSAWSVPNFYSLYTIFDKKVMEKKISSILCHKSQMNTNFMGGINSFHEHIYNRNKNMCHIPDKYLECFIEASSK